MDHQQLKKIERLYHCILENQELKKQDLSVQLGCHLDELNTFILKLSEMGLSISQTSQSLQLIHKVDYLNTAQLKQRLNQAGINVPIHYRFTCASTSNWAQSDGSPGLYLCEHQSAGRGRLQRQWLTPLGQSIALSLNYTFNLALNDLSGLNIAIAVAIINTAQACGMAELSVKWPNDILKDKSKVAGILLQASGNKHKSQVTIGIGINWNIQQVLLDTINQPCRNLGIKKYSRTHFIALLMLEMKSVLAEFNNNKLQNILPLWNQSDAYKNKRVNIIEGDHIYAAIYKGITQEGALKVQVNDKVKIMASGEVSMRSLD